MSDNVINFPEDYEDAVKEHKEMLDDMLEFGDKEYNSRIDIWTKLFFETESKLLNA